MYKYAVCFFLVAILALSAAEGENESRLPLDPKEVVQCAIELPKCITEAIKDCGVFGIVSKLPSRILTCVKGTTECLTKLGVEACKKATA